MYNRFWKDSRLIFKRILKTNLFIWKTHCLIKISNFKAINNRYNEENYWINY
jgi:hypothetical protein